jgi:hypothetical protein
MRNLPTNEGDPSMMMKINLLHLTVPHEAREQTNYLIASCSDLV